MVVYTFNIDISDNNITSIYYHYYFDLNKEINVYEYADM